METSAKNATNVEQAFMAMAADIKTRYPFMLYMWFDVFTVIMSNKTLKQEINIIQWRKFV